MYSEFRKNVIPTKVVILLSGVNPFFRITDNRVGTEHCSVPTISSSYCIGYA
ncbi:MAG: hypothetical protein ABSG15_09540 [FCB group bacterium]